MFCKECGNDISILKAKELNLISRPNRHMCSPNKASFKLVYCSSKCKERRNKDREIFFAELDRNCSDCISFKHETYITIYRKGRCIRDNTLIKVEPLMSMEKDCFKRR